MSNWHCRLIHGPARCGGGGSGHLPQCIVGLSSSTHRTAGLIWALRAHGILIGDRETIGLLEVCDHLYWVREWRRYGSGAATVGENFSPVHSRSLTALYFPNALSGRAARHRKVP